MWLLLIFPIALFGCLESEGQICSVHESSSYLPVINDSATYKYVVYHYDEIYQVNGTTETLDESFRFQLTNWLGNSKGDFVLVENRNGLKMVVDSLDFMFPIPLIGTSDTSYYQQHYQVIVNNGVQLKTPTCSFNNLTEVYFDRVNTSENGGFQVFLKRGIGIVAVNVNGVPYCYLSQLQHW